MTRFSIRKLGSEYVIFADDQSILRTASRRKAAKLIAVRVPQSLQCRPGLTRRWDELPLVDADRTRTRRSVGGRILRAAGGADEGWHDGRIHQGRREGHSCWSFLLVNPATRWITRQRIARSAAQPVCCSNVHKYLQPDDVRP